jgi:WD40 repeat protein/serine/threonine protein kinase
MKSEDLKREAAEQAGPTQAFPPEGTPSEADGLEAATVEWQNYLLPSTRLGALGRLGHYDILELRGRGGMGVVLKGFDEKLQRPVAVKLLAPALAGSVTARKRFVREARAAAAVRHSHVVTIHEVDESGSLPFLVMEFIDGDSLGARLRASGPLDPPEVVRISIQIAEGLAAAHKQGLVHRDIKPGNILLENDSSDVKITDFGLARAVDDANLTQSGVIAGTPMFMAPEQALGQSVDHRADLFSLGSVIYAMCTGHSPFAATGSMAVIRRVCDEPHQPIREVSPNVPDWLCAVIDKLLAKDREKRFSSAKELAEELRRHATSTSVAFSDVNRDGKPDLIVTGQDGVSVLIGNGDGTFQAPLRVRRQASPIVTETFAPSSTIRPSSFMWRRRLTWAAGAAAFLVLLAVALVSLPISWPWRSASEDGVEVTPLPAPVPKVDAVIETLPPKPVARPPRELKPGVADALKRNQIPSRFLELAGGGHAGKAPPELVAVLGEDNWLVPYGGKGSWIDVSPDSKLIAIPSNDTVSIFETETGKHQRTLTGINGHVTTAVFSPSGRELAVGSQGGDNVIRLFNVADGREIRSFQGSKLGVNRVAFAPPDGKLLASAGGDSDKGGEVIIWDVATGQKEQELPETAFPVRNVAFAPNSAAGASGVLATVSDGARVRIWDSVTGKLVKTLPFLPKGPTYGLAFSQDGQFLAAGNSSDTMVWSTANWSVHATRKTPGEWLAWRADPQVLLASWAHNSSPKAKPGNVALLYLDDKKIVNVSLAIAYTQPEVSLSLSPDGNQLYAIGTAAPFDHLTRRSVDLKAKAWLRGTAPQAVQSMSVSPDGRWLAVGLTGGQVRCWDLATGQPGPALKDEKLVVDKQMIGFSPDSSLLAVVSAEIKASAKQDPEKKAPAAQAYTVHLWDPASGALVRSFPGFNDPLSRSFSFNPKGTLLAFPGNTTNSPGIIGWRLADGEQIYEPLWAKAGDVLFGACSPDGAWLAMTAASRVGAKQPQQLAVTIFDARSGEVVQRLPIAGTAVRLTFSADGKTLAWQENTTTTPAGYRIRLVDVPSWKELPGPPAVVGTTIQWALHPWARQIALALLDGTVRLWESSTSGEHVFTFGPDAFGKRATNLAFTPEGSYLAVGDTNGNVSLLRLPAVLPAGKLPSSLLAPPAPLVAFPKTPPPPGTFPVLPVPSAQALANKPSPADALKRADIPSDILAKLGTGNNDAARELVAVLGKVGDPQVVGLSITGDGRYLATIGVLDSKALLFDLTDGRFVKNFPGREKAGEMAFISPDGSLVAIAGKTNFVDVFEVGTGNLRATITSVSNRVLEMAWNPDGSLLAIGDYGNVKLWHAESGAERAIKPGFNQVNRMAFSPDGKFLACGGVAADKQRPVVILEVATGKVLGALSTNIGLGLSWHPNGQQLASNTKDGSVRLWDVPAMKELQVLPSDAETLHGLAWHPSGKFLASGNHSGGTVTLWNMELSPPRYRVIHLFPPDAQSAKAAVSSNNDILFTPEGRYLIAGNADGTISVLRLAELGQLVK